MLNGPGDLKELIPEFYMPDAGSNFFVNTDALDLGVRCLVRDMCRYPVRGLCVVVVACRQTGERVSGVQLPPWARNADDCIVQLRQALESEYVSQVRQRLHTPRARVCVCA